MPFLNYSHVLFHSVFKMRWVKKGNLYEFEQRDCHVNKMSSSYDNEKSSKYLYTL